MKIYVDKIPEESLILVEQLDPHKISLDLNEQLSAFIKPIKVEAKFKKIDREVFVDVSLEAPCEYTCARCLAKFEDVFKKEFDLNYEVKSGDLLEIDEDIRQEMIVDYPMKVTCKSDCKGLCPNCGQNLNVSKCDCNTEVT